MSKKRYYILLLIGMLLVAACGSSGRTDRSRVREVYYINNSETGVEMHEYEMLAEDAEGQLAELLEQLGTMPPKLEYKAPLQMGFTLLSAYIDGEKLYLDVSEGYRGLSATTEILVRAALVRTMSQVEGIKYVAITVEGSQLHDSLGNIVGLMSAEQFIDNAGDEINAYDKVRLRLYFANEDGTALVATNRTMAYNTNISLERLVVEQLLSGPGADVADVVYPVMNPNTKIVSVSVRDGICYVNFDENFLNQTYNVSSEVAIYSIVNSLGELTNVNRVQISVNGETDIMYRESISLSTVFERNLDLITTVEQ
ncbi:MAG: GerMN domain-containing protein [Lachnospiraceae bacterium]|nr:GerMN domain-containing protein [Lachnospiraceae bacterium]MBD5497774.1 GerMN domain-containing protein [Lachnospiraceae bacterium]